MSKPHNVSVVSDFNAELVARYISADRSMPACAATSAPYGQVFQVLSNEEAVAPDTVALIWTRPEGVIPEYAKLLAGQQAEPDRLDAEIDAFAAMIKRFASRCKYVFVASWAPTFHDRGLGLLNWGKQGAARQLARMNLRLAEQLGEAADVFMLDSQRWIDASDNPRDRKSWYLAKAPFTEKVCKAAAADLKSALRTASGQNRKLVVVDLDDTMWGGIVGDDGWENLRLGGHDHVGEAYSEFQSVLKTLVNRGIAIAVVSKNDEAVALEAITKHPEMIIRKDDLAAWRINWKDKAQNIAELVEELNLGLQSTVFIDDNPIERGRVREALPEVLVPEWPSDPSKYADALRQLDCFDRASVTSEDRERTRMYVQERERRESLTVASSLDDWHSSLDVRVHAGPVSASNVKRIVQLMNKTNQLNLRTRRTTEKELHQWLESGTNRNLAAVTVSDRFGDLGLTGIVSWEQVGEAIEIVDYVLSCRAMGRQVEQLMVHLAVQAASRAGCDTVIARFIPTAKNRPCLEFWQNSGFSDSGDNVFVWKAASDYPKPAFITLENDVEPARHLAAAI
ncbi:HAD-IIIC family phosphatase [Bradyrhizobium tropiciagri]|uniref:HAD-IIIC family phosphatase n=1 Tax=Bradyrhizobium tropiciagri TaxID=312253 RepID=UPI001BAB7EFC|nr:HAD-IIIC family phosphatase [Bradyrhizobium tropiciagri]MBR0875129.1 HAD-IIIC family phosphatase [Bradyrhizobium tropiciagri]